jgi:hypothetical protein
VPSQLLLNENGNRRIACQDLGGPGEVSSLTIARDHSECDANCKRANLKEFLLIVGRNKRSAVMAKINGLEAILKRRCRNGAAIVTAFSH